MNFLNKKIIAVIPARGGSKSIPLKNIVPLAGKPLIYYSIKTGLDIGFDRLIVSTDHDEIAKVSEKYGAEVIIRPAELSKDESPTVDCLKHVLDELKKENCIPDLVVLLQPTTPIRTKKSVESAIEKFIKVTGQYDSLMPFCEVEGKVGKIVDGCYQPNYQPGTRRQDMEKLYRECGYVYIFKPDLINIKDMFGQKIFPFIIKDFAET
ncbi:MAG: acylneuraminate cytidylyltransferase family protein, partial [Patescibacteria group bacterium]